MKILVDTNILLDVLAEREPFYLFSARIWSLIQEELIEGYISAISVNNLFYIIRKLKGQKPAELFVDHVLNDFGVIDLTGNILKQARTVSKKDFEDLIQYFSALHEGCDIILTRNKRDFPATGIALMSPQELLRKLKNPSS